MSIHDAISHFNSFFFALKAAVRYVHYYTWTASISSIS